MRLRFSFYAISLVAVLAGCGQSGGDAEESQRLVLLGRDLTHAKEALTPEQLSSWIVTERKDFLLLDVRAQDAYRAGHIRTAESVPLTYLFEPSTIRSLPEDRVLVVYSDAERKAMAATTVLRLAGRHAYLLEGGYRGWQDRILHPREVPDETQQETRKRIAVACFFGAESRATDQPPVPLVQPLQTPAADRGDANLKPPPRHRREIIEEGC